MYQPPVNDSPLTCTCMTVLFAEDAIPVEKNPPKVKRVKKQWRDEDMLSCILCGFRTSIATMQSHYTRSEQWTFPSLECSMGFFLIGNFPKYYMCRALQAYSVFLYLLIDGNSLSIVGIFYNFSFRVQSQISVIQICSYADTISQIPTKSLKSTVYSPPLSVREPSVPTCQHK